MTTRVHYSEWGLRALLLLLVLTGFRQAQAEDEYYEGDAFYVYQNDGHFNGFFYSDVQQISYSCLDTLGREHDHYVSQEIVTADSTYRIMLTAIDSVSFVQPVNLLNENVRLMEFEGMMDYFITDMDMTLAFDQSMPDYLRPKVGDVLACPAIEGREGAFVGKVKSISERDNILIVRCDYIDKLGDVFDRFVGVEQVQNVMTPQGLRTRRRVAGLPKELAQTNARKRIEGNIEDYTLFGFDASLDGTMEFGKVKFGIGVTAGFGMTINAVYNIGWDHLYIKQDFKEQVTAGLKVSVDGELYNNADLTALPGVGALVKRFSRVPFPAAFPILYANVMPMPFARAEAHLNLNINSGVQVQALAQSLEIRDSWPFVSVKANPIAPFLPLPGTLEPDGSFTVSAQLNGSFQSGMKFPLETGIEEWLQKLLNIKVENTLYAGPKLSGTLNFDLLKATAGAYESLKDSKVDLSLMSFDSEFSIKGSILGHETELKKTYSWKYGNYALKLFPGIDNVKFDVTGDLQNTVTCTFDVQDDVCLPEAIGFALYTKENEKDTDFTKLYRRATRDEMYFLNTFNNVDLRMEDLEPGVYMARPIVVAPFGVVPVYKDEQLLTVAQKDLMLKPQTIKAEEQGGTHEVEVLGSLDMPINAYPQDDWITAEVKQNVGSTRATMLYVTVKENNTDHYRHGSVIVRMRLKTDEVVERTLDVYQFGGLELSPSELSFKAAESKGSVEVLTSCQPITISVPEEAKEWLDARLDGRVMSVTAKENKGANRQATIIVSAWSEKHKGISTVKLLVKQEGPVDVTLSKDQLKFGPNGGGEQVNLTMGGNYSFTDTSIRIDGQGWLTVERHDKYFIVNCMPNDTGRERWSYVYLSFTKNNPQAKGPDTYELPVLVEQELGGEVPGPDTGSELIGPIKVNSISNLNVMELNGYITNGQEDPKYQAYKMWDVLWAQSFEGGEANGLTATLYDDHVHLSGEMKWNWFDEEDYADHGSVHSTVEFDLMKTKDKTTGEVMLRVENFKYVLDEKTVRRNFYDTYDSDYHVEIELDFGNYAYSPISGYDDNEPVVDNFFRLVESNVDTNTGMALKRFVCTKDIQYYDYDGDWKPASKERVEWKPYLTANKPFSLDNGISVGFEKEKWKEWILK